MAEVLTVVVRLVPALGGLPVYRIVAVVGNKAGRTVTDTKTVVDSTSAVVENVEHNHNCTLVLAFVVGNNSMADACLEIALQEN